ncbi:MAG: metalloprotease PmbA [Pseudomonadales bacterium]
MEKRTDDTLDVRNERARLQELATDILAEARRQGASAAEVSASVEAGLTVTVRMGALETVEFNQDRGFGITVYVGARKGSASTSDSRPQAIAETVRAALNIARHTQEDRFNGLADPGLAPRQLPDLDLFHPWTIDPAGAEALALACEGAARSMDDRIVNSEGAQVSTYQACRVYGNSQGFLGTHAGTRHALSATLIAEAADGMQRDYWYTQARNPDALDPAEAVGREAARRTLARLSPRKAPTGRFPVLFVPMTAAGLISSLLGALAGGAQYRKASFLLDSLGQTVTSPMLSLVERPFLPGRIGSASFDSDGVATSEKAFIRHGVVERYILSAYSARRLNLRPEGNADGVHNLLVQGDVRPQAELLRLLGRGLIVTELIGQGVNGVTGDYSRGAAGFWVENGEAVWPVDECTVAGNLRDMFRDIVAIGDDPDLRGNLNAPSMLVGSLMIAGG